MFTAIRGPVVAVSVLVVALVTGEAAASSANPVRRQIKQARRDLVSFEQELADLVDKFEVVEHQLGTVRIRAAAARRTIRKLDRASGLAERAVAGIVIEPLARAALWQATEQRDVLEELVPAMRRQIWVKGAERKDLIDKLDAAIELLQSTRTGKLITRAGVDSGQLITYSADWAAVAQCESSGRWHINVGLFDGGLQFLPSTWWGFGGGEYAPFAYQATPRQQIDIAERVLAVQGPKAWPNCFEPLPVDTDE